MANDDGSLWIVYNGEVYNFLEVREALSARGHRFCSKTDTEVVLKAYEEYGEGFLQHLNGMFALAIWDARRRRLLVADILFDERTRRRPYFNHVYIKQLFAAHQNGRHVYSDQLWLLLNFELWHRQFLDAAPGAP